MIAELPKLLVVLLAVLTLLGAVMGYCVALIRTKRQARKAIESSRRKLLQEQRATESDLQVARRKIEKLRATVRQSPHEGDSASEREKALQAQSELQAQRVQTLEAQLASLEQNRSTSDSWSNTEKLPTLSRRVGLSADQSKGGEQTIPGPDRAAPSPSRPGSSGPINADRAGSRISLHQRDSLSTTLSRELDIPALAESELPDSVDELEFDLSGKEDGEDLSQPIQDRSGLTKPRE